MVASWRKRVDVLLVGLLVGALGVLAFLHPGVRAAELELHDGGAWVTNQAKNLVAHLNYDAKTLDGGLRTTTGDFDVSQAGTHVLVTGPATVAPIDTSTVTFTGESALADTAVAHGGDAVLFAAAGKASGEGKVWSAPASEAGSFNAAVDATVEDLDRPRVVVGVDGTGYILTADGVVRRVRGAGADAQVAEIGRIKAEIGEGAQLSVAGDRLLVLDGSLLRTTDRDIDLGVADAVLQQPGTARDQAVVATKDALLRVSLAGGVPQTVEAPGGRPSAPVLMDGCAYGLWAGSGFYARQCADRALDHAAQYPELASATAPVFRVNRSVIVINDLVSGAVYLPLESMQRVDNWDLISARTDDTEQQLDEESEETENSQLAEFSEEQRPPVANDDDLGARPGVATTLPVLLNDVDLDGDVLTAVLKDVPKGVSVALARNGRAVRVEVPGDRTGSFDFTYQASDGRDVSNTAKVHVAIRPLGANGAPARARKTTLNLAERASVEYAVLQDWVDPDGDPMFLANAVGEDGLPVTWRPDGHLSIRDIGTNGPGRRVVTVEVSDGTTSATEEIVVQVTPGATNQAPVANFDHYVANVGEAVTLHPLANDTDPENAELRLVEIGPTDPAVSIQRDPLDSSLQFTATRPGTQVFVYAITDGPNTAKGKVRVDVSDPKKADPQPAAENDLALLPHKGAVLVEPLRNDFDPAGGVLVIQGVSMGSSDGLNVEVVRHSSLRVTAPAGLEAPQTFEYTVSNGARSATAKVLVIPLETKSAIQAPVARPETTVVRAGDIVTMGVLANDYSPSDLPISLRPELQVRGTEGMGEFFVAGDKVRFKAGDHAGQTEATYTIEDSEGNLASSVATVTVIGFDAINRPPVPPAVEARTFAGMSVRVALPMDGVDPDGDSLELVGASGERLGSVTVQGNYLEYQAGDEATGTDVFSYRARDRFGAEGEGVVRVGVAPAPTLNQAPVAVPDDVAARPRTRLEIPVTRNDVDPDGDDISLVADSIEPITAGWDPQAEINGQRVIVLTPAERGIYQFYYRITDGGGAPVTGVATVQVDENVLPVAPVAQDDFVPVNTLAGLDAVEVPVLVNDSDPDGVTKDLTVTADGDAHVAGGVVTVPLADDRRIVLYTVTDRDGLSARAAIVVPGRAQIPPYLDPAKIPAVVKGGETLTIDFADLVITRPGHSAKLTSVDSVVAGQGGNTSDADLGLKVESDTRLTFTPDARFKGATSVGFQVTDGDTIDDPRGLVASLSLPITVESSGLFPPELRPSEVQVAPGERPLDVSLAAMVNDPDPGDNEKMSFAVVSAPARFTVAMAGQTAQVSAAADAPVGTTGSLVVRVHDGSTDPLEMTVPLRVVGSTRPTMTVTDINETDGRVGTALTWNLASYVTNPFADVGGEIALVGQPQVTGPATVRTEGLNLVVTPTNSGAGGDAAEQAVVTYTVADATKDPARNKTGVARVTVKDVPKAPVDVAAEYVGSRTARVSWNHTGWRGGTRSGFLVSWNGGSKACGLVTSCVIDTLTNNNTYTFTVQAQVTEADIADSPASAPSNAIFVDVAPSQPSAPSVVFGDGDVALSWPQTSVPDGGSAVTKHTVEISPADASGRTQQEVSGASQSGWRWTNLRNGVEYRFRISAHNKQTDADTRVTPPQSGWSEGVMPAGRPSLMGAPTVVKDKAAAGVAPRATVGWGAPGNPNGDTAFTYRLRMSGSGETLYEGADASRVVSMTVGTDDKSFEVQVTNKSQQWSDWSPASNKVRAFQPPGAPSGFSLAATGVSNQARFTFSAAPGNGAKPDELSYRWSAGGASGTVTSGQTIANGAFVNGSNVSVTLTAISTVSGETATGESATATVNAYAPPGAPTVSANRAGNGNVDYAWSMPASSNGRNVEVQITTTQNGNQRAVSLSGSLQEGTAHDQQRCIRVRAINTEGQGSDWIERCATTRGNGIAKERAGSAKVDCPTGVTGGTNGCRTYELELLNWYPNSAVYCSAVGTNGTTGSTTYRVNGDGWAAGKLGEIRVAIDWSGFHEGGQVDACRYA